MAYFFGCFQYFVLTLLLNGIGKGLDARQTVFPPTYNIHTETHIRRQNLSGKLISAHIKYGKMHSGVHAAVFS